MDEENKEKLNEELTEASAETAAPENADAAEAENPGEAAADAAAPEDADADATEETENAGASAEDGTEDEEAPEARLTGLLESAEKRYEMKLVWAETLGLQPSDVEAYDAESEKAKAGAGSGEESPDGSGTGSGSHSAAAAGHSGKGTGRGKAVTEGADAAEESEYRGGSGEGGRQGKKSGKKNGGKPRRRVGRFIFTFILGAVCALGALMLASRMGLLGHLVSNSDYLYYSGLDASYGKFSQIMEMIGEDPIADKDPKDITDEELKEIVASIGDPYAEYYTAAEYQELQKKYLDEYVGIGVGISEEDGAVVIKTIFEGSPAESAGFEPEDVILKIDGKEPESVDDAVMMISGEAGTEVTVTIKRGDKTQDITVTRDKIETDSVGYEQVPDHPEIGFIRMTMFRKGTDDEFKEAVSELQEKGCSKFILDLRDNGGGLTDVCIEIADYLLPSCKIMSENTKRGRETVYNSKESSADLDLVVLVNENTASASEILTAALQDNNACTVIGTETYGKGVIQIVHQFDDGSAIKITTSEYFRPNGKPVNEVGITPDIEAIGTEAVDKAIKELGD